MPDQTDENRALRLTPGAPAPEPAADPLSESTAELRRIARSLDEIRGMLEAVSRERAHREFSPVRLLGAILQAFVVGLLAAAVADWLFQEAAAAEHGMLIKLCFAAVFQLCALTAFAAAGRHRG